MSEHNLQNVETVETISDRKMEKEMITAELQSNTRQGRALTWTFASIALIILTALIFVLAIFFLPSKTLQTLDDNANTPTQSSHQK